MPSRSDSTRPPQRAFTLIELLIVVSIITILSAIAIPNFLDAQTRAKVVRAQSDMRTVMFAVQAYTTDNRVPPDRHSLPINGNFFPEIPVLSEQMQQMKCLTTPIAYIRDLPIDIFAKEANLKYTHIDYYDSIQVSMLVNRMRLVGHQSFFLASDVSWLVVSVGPDHFLGPLQDYYHDDLNTPLTLKGTIFMPYDPTNGTVSAGNLYGSDDGGLDGAGTRMMQRALPPFN